MNFRMQNIDTDKPYACDKLSDEQLDRIIAMHKHLVTGKDIAAKMDIPIHIVYSAIHKWKKLDGWEFEWSETKTE